MIMLLQFNPQDVAQMNEDHQELFQLLGSVVVFVLLVAFAVFVAGMRNDR